MHNSTRRSFSFGNRYISILVLSIVGGLLLGTLGVTLAQQSTQSVVATVKRAGANLRQGPGLQYEILGVSRRGAVLPVVGQFTNDVGEVWYSVYVEAFGEVWVASWVVRLNVIQTSVPVVSPQTGVAAPATSLSGDIIITAMPNNFSNTGGGNNNPPPPQTTPDP